MLGGKAGQCTCLRRSVFVGALQCSQYHTNSSTIVMTGAFCWFDAMYNTQRQNKKANKGGITPVMDASGKGHVEAVRTLHVQGADIHAVDFLVSRHLVQTRTHTQTSPVTSLLP